MRAVILAAGEGTRMRPLTENKPKVMLPLANKPMLEHTLLAARDAGITDILLIVGYRKESIIDYFGDGSRLGLNIEYVTQERQRGTGDAFGMAAGHFDRCFVAMNGDITVSAAHLKKLACRKEDAVISVKQVANPAAFGVIETNGALVTRIVEKSPQPPTNLANAGVYLFSPSIFEAIAKTTLSPRGEIEVTDSLQSLIDAGKSVGYEVMGEDWMDIGRPWDLLTANELMLKSFEALDGRRSRAERDAERAGLRRQGHRRPQRRLHRRPRDHRGELRHRPELLHPGPHEHREQRPRRQRRGDQELRSS